MLLVTKAELVTTCAPHYMAKKTSYVSKSRNCHNSKQQPFAWKIAIARRDIFKEYHVLMPGDHIDLGTITLDVFKSIRTKIAQALPAEIAAATNKRKEERRYAVNYSTKAAFRYYKQSDDDVARAVKL